MRNKITHPEVQEIIDMLIILESHGIDLKNIKYNSNIKLKDIEGIEFLIECNNWTKEFNIGRATQKILASAKNQVKHKYNINSEQINKLKELGLLTNSEIEHSEKKSNADKLIDVLDVLEAHTPGISVKLPKKEIAIGDIEEISDIVESIGLPKKQKINIANVVNDTKKQIIGVLDTSRISPSTIEKLKKYGLITEEDIHNFKLRKESIANGNSKTKVQRLIEILQILEDNGIDILKLSKTSKKVGQIDYLKDIIKQENIDENYDIGQTIKNTIVPIKEKSVGRSNHYAISDDEIEKMKNWGFISDKDIQKYQKYFFEKEDISVVEKFLKICKKIQSRRIQFHEILVFGDVEIGQIKDVKWLEQTIAEENIPKTYRFTLIRSRILRAAKKFIFEKEYPEYKSFMNYKTLKINDSQIDELMKLGLLRKESINKYIDKKLREIKKSAITNDTSNAIEQLMKQAVAEHVQENEATRNKLSKELNINEHNKD